MRYERFGRNLICDTRGKILIRRTFAVKELSWCAPSDSPNRTTAGDGTRKLSPNESEGDDDLMPIPSFGIVAAMSRNRVIGVDGHLPWNLPSDRARFKDLTRSKILILGRRTLEEEPSLVHISHSSHAIVLSRTMTDNDPSSSTKIVGTLSIATSFAKALDQARQIASQTTQSTGDNDGRANSIPCWVVGGERLYHEALLHPSASELHLTVVDSDVDEKAHQQVARFPAKYRWDSKFELVSSEAQTDAKSGLCYQVNVYRRLRGLR